MDKIQKSPHISKVIKRARVNSAGTTEDVYYYHLLHDELPREFQKYPEAELNETPENVSRGMQALKKFLHDREITDVEDSTLMLFLRSCKFDTKKAVGKFENFLKTRKALFDRLDKMDMDKVQCILEDKSFVFLPYRDRFGRAILYTQPNINLERYDVDDAFTCFFYAALYILPYPMTTIFGVSQIGNCKTPSLTLLYKIMMVYKNYLRQWLFPPAMLKKVYIVNENIAMRWFYNIIRPIIPTKIYQRISFHGTNFESLQEFYHPDLLPEECGGNMGPLNLDFYKEDMINFIKKLKEEHRQKAEVQSKKI